MTKREGWENLLNLFWAKLNEVNETIRERRSLIFEKKNALLTCSGLLSRFRRNCFNHCLTVHMK